MSSPGIGRQHPDLSALLKKELIGTDERAQAEGYNVAPITNRPLSILQQRTLYDQETVIPAKNRNLSITQKWSESVGLYSLHYPEHKALILIHAVRTAETAPWRTASFEICPCLINPPSPFTGVALGGAGRAIIGGIVSDPEIHALRLTLHEGTTFVDSVADGSVLLFVHAQAAERWQEPAVIDLLGSDGLAIPALRSYFPVHPNPPPAALGC